VSRTEHSAVHVRRMRIGHCEVSANVRIPAYVGRSASPTDRSRDLGRRCRRQRCAGQRGVTRAATHLSTITTFSWCDHIIVISPPLSVVLSEARAQVAQVDARSGCRMTAIFWCRSSSWRIRRLSWG